LVLSYFSSRKCLAAEENVAVALAATAAVAAMGISFFFWKILIC
jgi:hypothetical protein